MCGIVGYIGRRPAQSILLDSLAKLEYRGYDSCGIALSASDPATTNPSGIKIFKDAIRVEELAKTIPLFNSTVGIGHTRWATHGSPCLINSHPHNDCTGKIAVVHNGVISNYQKLREQLTLEGHKLVSDTDTEVIPHLIEKYYQGNLETAVKKAIRCLEGAYAIIVMAEGGSELVFARKDSPLIIGIGDGENLIASDVPAVLEYTSRVIYLEDGDIGTVTSDIIKISQNGTTVSREEKEVLWEPEQAQRGGYEHFMLKEIHEQPQIIRDTLSEYLFSSTTRPDIINLQNGFEPILFLACGTSYHAGLIGKYIIEKLTDTSARAELASEFNYYDKLKFSPVTVAITQSGETADTLKAMRRSKQSRSRVVTITNVVGSTASRIADHTIYTRAGPEISVAATKSFIAQLLAIYWLTLSNAGLDPVLLNNYILELRHLPDKVQQVLATRDIIAAHAAKLARCNNAFYIGRGLNYPVALEGALKLKEISYIPCEAYAAGEIKHGPFALLSKDTPVIALVARDASHDAMLTSIKEIKARGSPVFAVAEENDETVLDLADYVISVPSTLDLFSPFINTVVVQLLAYYSARQRQCPIDFPRNLAKSVTVE